jgi:hypothetical protein
MTPAGLMWSVVTEWPTLTEQRAPAMGWIGLTVVTGMSTKNGGSWM